MRVLLTSHRFPPDNLGGVEYYTERLAIELVKLGDTVRVFTRRWGNLPQIPQLLREELPAGHVVYRVAGGGLPGLDAFYLDHFLLHAEVVEELFTAVMKEKTPDVVHVNHLAGLSPRLIDIAQRHGAAVVLSLHDFFFACPRVHLQKLNGEVCAGPDGGRECARTCYAGVGQSPALRWGLRHHYFRRWLRLAQRVISNSNYIKTYFENFGVPPDRLRNIPPGVSFDATGLVIEASTTPQQRGVLKLAYFGTVAPHKGPHVILEALQQADVGRVEVLVIGPYDDRAYARRLREQAAATPGLKFRMYGPFRGTNIDLPLILSDTDCVVLPSLVPEAGPSVPREALALGLPILVARLGAMPELVREGENGFTFDPKRPAELTTLLLRLKWDEGLVQRLRRGARQTAVGTVAEHTAEVRTIYQEALEDLQQHGPPAAEDVAEVEFLHNALLEAGFGSWEDAAPAVEGAGQAV
jgi:glycosyltransferase involved in cell wall biosynthesis